MEVYEEIVIVGAGIGGLATALGLHRIGVRSIILESADSLRTTGFALTLWSNAWKALDALGIGDLIRETHGKIERLKVTSIVTGLTVTDMSVTSIGNNHNLEVRCVRRKFLIETIKNELPEGTIRFGSKVVSIDQDGKEYMIHLADGTLVRGKVLVGCDGVNSVVAKWVGLQRPAFSGRCAVRGLAHFPQGHGFEHSFCQFFGNGIRFGFLPCDENTVYWFFTLSAKPQDETLLKGEALKLKELVLRGIMNDPQCVRVLEHTQLHSIVVSPLNFRSPWSLLWGKGIHKGNVCLAGDAMHPMTPDIGQGGCSTLEDAVVLSRCLGEAFKRNAMKGKKIHGPTPSCPPHWNCEIVSSGSKRSEDYEELKIKEVIAKYVKARRRRWFSLTFTSYWVGVVQQSSSGFVSFVRDKFLLGILSWILVERTMFDCGALEV